MPAKPITASHIANFFINFFHKHGDYLTNLKLQKLLYFSQAWHLAFYENPLFDDEIQAWVHGPVVPNIYRQFKKYEWHPIDEQPAEPKLNDSLVSYLKEIVDYYGNYSAYELEKITHTSKPWLLARKDLPDDAPSNEIISNESMRTYYQELMRQNGCEEEKTSN